MTKKLTGARKPPCVLVEIVYALPTSQTLLLLKVESESSVRAVILQSGILDKHDDIDLNINKVGIFGKLVKLDKTIREKDRIEIYRPLIADPKEVRKQRAATGKTLKKRKASIETDTE